MSIIARQSTARTVMVGPILDSAGAAVTNAVVGGLKISVNGGEPGALNGSATLTHRHTGHYSLALTATDLGSVGSAEIVIDATTNAMPVKVITVVEEAVYDALFAASAAGYASLASVTTLIGSASITVNGPLTSSTTIEVVEQDDYHNDDGRAISFTGTFSSEDITSATVNFRVTNRATGTNIIDTTGSVVTATGTQVVRVNLTSAQVALLVAEGKSYSFHCRLTHDTRKITVARGSVTAFASLFTT